MITRTDYIIKACPANYQSIGKQDFKPNSIWYAYITGTNPNTGKIQQIRYKKDINRIKDLKERKNEMKALLDILKDKISVGWCPFTDKIVSNEFNNYDVSMLVGAIDFFIDIKKNSIRPRTLTTYTSIIKIFKKWLFENKIEYILTSNFKITDAQKYMDYILINRSNSNFTHNNVLIGLRSIFNFFVEREIIKINPFKKIKKLPAEKGKNSSYTDDEIQQVDNYLLENDKRLYYFKEFIYCAGIRRTELTLIKVRDVLQDTILLRSDLSKNRKQESVIINKKLRNIINEMELNKYNPDDYIFGKKLQTCSDKFPNPNHITSRFKEITKQLNIRDECTLYSWKHTGAINLYNATKDPYLVMRHLRHHSLEMTMIYLRSLGINADEKLKELSW